ncbi:ubiquitin carboxyl-terminal hydrolase 6 [Pholiota conissans]|uniref:Ubiquitin carboxyl-terminal hydrolase n=1 Tax=Pholiota conissans TaxID=109636 RepID=A0A9P5Z7I4_9AGAR|nr:ubiquitin carboxyl-terminal hydrolase 6 [Pholiota conissans]
MAPIQINIKHAGKTYSLPLDPDLPPAVFKDTVYNATGVPPDRMKVMVKGGVLKGQTFTVIGAAGELPKPPQKPIVFLEDMDDSELAEALAKPVGLTNLGNTCYMNATVQALRAVPELQVALSAPSLQSTTPLPGALRDLYSNMSKTTDSITPVKFLQVLREVNPQFAEMDRREAKANDFMMGRQGYAQQDAEECYGAIVNTLRNVPGLDASGKSVSTGAEASIGSKHFVEQYMMGEMRRELTCDESTVEPPSVSTEHVLKIECNILMTTNFMLSGIMNSLDTKVEKNSPSLGRQAVYSQKSRLTRLPTYLTVHMVRFAWRADIGKKAKIMRKVKFPQEFDALDLATDDLRAKLLPASRKLKEIEKERGERRKVRKRTKNAVSAGPSTSAVPPTVDVEMGDAAGIAAAVTTGDIVPAAGADASKANAVDEFEDEVVVRKREVAELAELISPEVRNDIGASATGLYDLVAIVTHKGAAADAGHYIGFVKKSVFNAYSNKKKTAVAASAAGEAGEASSSTATAEPTAAEIDALEDDEDWYKFDDEKVSLFPKEKLATLDGGGEDSSAYVLLYKSKSVV